MANKCAIVLFGVAGITAIAGLLIVGIVLKSYFDPFDDAPFTPAAWTAADPAVRATIAHDVVRRLGTGMTADQVKDTLGEATPVHRYSGGVDAYGHHLGYPETWSCYLGCWSTYGLDDAFVYVHFDLDRRVALVEITGG